MSIRIRVIGQQDLLAVEYVWDRNLCLFEYRRTTKRHSGELEGCLARDIDHRMNTRTFLITEPVLGL